MDVTGRAASATSPEEDAPGATRIAPPGRLAGVLRLYATFVVRRPVLVLVLLTMVSLPVAVQIRNLRLGLRLSDFLPTRHPNTRIFEKIRDLFGLEKTALVAIEARDGDVFTADMLAKIREATRRAEKLAGVAPGGVISLASPRITRVVVDGDNLDVVPLLEDTPLAPEALSRLRREALDNPLYRNLLVSGDGTAAAITVNFDDSVPNLEMRSALEEIAAGVRDPHTAVFLGGVPVLNAYLEEYSKRVALIFPLTLAIVALIHYEAFRTLQAVILPLLTALLSLVLSLGLIGLLGYTLDPWNAVTPIIIVAIAAGHAVQVLKRYYEEFARSGDSRQAVIDSMAAIGPVMLTAGGIAAAGFASLATFGVPSVRVLGTLLACGVLAALVVELTLIPACRALLPAPRRRELHREAAGSVVTRTVEALSGHVMRAPRRVLAIAAALVILAALGTLRVQVNNSYRDYFYPGTQARNDDDFINERFGGTVTLHLLVEATEPGALEDPRVVRAVADVERLLAGVPEIGKVMSYVGFLRDMHAAFRPAGATDDLPGTRGLVAQYLLLYATALGPDEFGWLLDANHSWALVIAFSRTDESAFARGLIDRLSAFADERFQGLPARLHIAAGALGLQMAMNEEVVGEKLRNMAQVALVILVLSSLALGSVTGGLLVLAPLALAVLVNLGVMGWSGTWLTMVTASISAMGVSIGADFAIYLLYRIREECGRGRSLPEAVRVALGTAGQAVCFVSSAIIGGYLTLTFAGFRMWVQVGGLTALMITTSALATLTVVPALALLLRPRFLTRVAAGRATTTGPDTLSAN